MLSDSVDMSPSQDAADELVTSDDPLHVNDLRLRITLLATR